MVLSLDGFATSPDGTHEWMFEWFGDDSGGWNRRALEEAGVHAMGRRSYEIMGPHWVASTGPIATAMNEKPKAVFSRTLQKAESGPAEIFGADLRAEIADLNARDDEGRHATATAWTSSWRSSKTWAEPGASSSGVIPEHSRNPACKEPVAQREPPGGSETPALGDRMGIKKCGRKAPSTWRLRRAFCSGLAWGTRTRECGKRPICSGGGVLRGHRTRSTRPSGSEKGRLPASS